MLVLRRTNPELKRGFRVPFGPYVIPGLSILACLYIMKGLPTSTFRIFLVWMVVTVVTYFAYSARNSRLNRG